MLHTSSPAPTAVAFLPVIGVMATTTAETTVMKPTALLFLVASVVITPQEISCPEELSSTTLVTSTLWVGDDLFDDAILIELNSVSAIY